MPIRYEKRFTVEGCRKNRNDLYLFGDNLKRIGKAGQAIIRDEPNAFGIPTKRGPSMGSKAFFTDADSGIFRLHLMPEINRARRLLQLGGFVVLPEDGIGTGLAQLETRAPLCWALLQTEVASLKQQAL